jgi:hypothetical protein
VCCESAGLKPGTYMEGPRLRSRDARRVAVDDEAMVGAAVDGVGIAGLGCGAGRRSGLGGVGWGACAGWESGWALSESGRASPAPTGMRLRVRRGSVPGRVSVAVGEEGSSRGPSLPSLRSSG